MAYNLKKETCDFCGKSKDDGKKMKYGKDGSVICSDCSVKAKMSYFKFTPKMKCSMFTV